jgi:hypothetical protein
MHSVLVLVRDAAERSVSHFMILLQAVRVERSVILEVIERRLEHRRHVDVYQRLTRRIVLANEAQVHARDTLVGCDRRWAEHGILLQFRRWASPSESR